ncbi:zinc-binding alcohol dehydrogenase family protein [Cellvibrio sp.]|uniref:zinc-binding alcohol dehydrogenase family protein n=1 Tax=Cellvibrio sp. TaxID=1965322 RepID=UPI00396476FB
MNQSMKAVGLKEYLPINHAKALIDTTLPVPTPGERDLLVRVEAVSVNPVDTKVRRSNRPAESDFRVLGWDAAGTVVAVGSKVEFFKPGDEVFYAGDITRAGSNSEFQRVDERIVGKKPKSVSVAEAAALPLTSITAGEGLFDRLGIIPENSVGKTVLIIGGAGGVGSIAIQLAKQITGLRIIATASRRESQEWCLSLGADTVIDHHQNMVEAFRAQGAQYADYIFCLNSTAKHWASMCELIAPQGTICSIVEPEAPLDLSLLKSKSVGFVWESMFTRSMFKTDDMQKQGALLNRIAAWIDEGKIKTSLNKTLSPINAENLKNAHAQIETGTTIGKIVVKDW